MHLLDLIKTRRSVRRFASAAVEEEKLELVLEAAKWAPSAGNLQARGIIVVREEKTKGELSDAALGQGFISEAPVVLVACANRMKSGRRYGSRGESFYSLQDAAAAVENMLLMAHSLGLATCWVGAFDDEKVKEILNIPEGVSPAAILPLGYPGEDPAAPPRRLDRHDERW